MHGLYFDIGNTRLKLWLCIDESVEQKLALPHQGDVASTLKNLPQAFAITPAFVRGACVLGEDAERAFAAACLAEWGISPQFAHSTASHAGVASAYVVNPESLGIDRWLGLIAARDLGTDACIVSCGSAVTLDILRADGQHQGGYILPGLGMMAGMLLTGTGRVRFDKLAWSSRLPGRSTAEAVAHGALAAIVALIEKVVLEGRLELVLTGGDAELIQAAVSCPARLEPELLLQGLQRYFTDAGIKGANAP